MSKPFHPPSVDVFSHASQLTAAIKRSLDDALFDLATTEKTQKSTLGVLPTLGRSADLASLSLGTPRLCNDQDPSGQRSELALGISGFNGSTPVACIEWQRVTFYREPTRTPRPPQDSLFRDQNLTRGIFNGYMSQASRRKVRKIVSTWIRSVMLYRAEVKKRWDPGRAYPVFLTVTLPSQQLHDDAVINRKILQPFLQKLKRDYEIENYFWRAEAQENGNVHFHILVDRYIPKRYLQLTWNMCTEVLGYLTAYYQRSGSLTPPSTEVHRIKDRIQDKKTGKWKTVDPVDYLLEYVMDTPQPEQDQTPDGEERKEPRKLVGRIRKQDGTIETYTTRAISGRVWGMSDSLREIREPRAEATVDMVMALEKARQQGILRRVDQEHATMYFGPVGLVLSRSASSAWLLVKEYYLQIFGYLYPDQLPAEYRRRHPSMDPRNLWIDFDNAALYHRLKLDHDSPVFETAADLDKWIEEQSRKQSITQQAA